MTTRKYSKCRRKSEKKTCQSIKDKKGKIRGNETAYAKEMLLAV